ncbi:MAG: RES family NAD+ phosphorylase [Gammaproteobacteria bacterium]|nr:RES family NAD+ phosphorylase [Gammaproteobacteria bacterium]NND38077.1 RES family NAD+ phosphorylase [Pseudomonadales bacterium]NNL10174.1 RES family NAD+ phosphorylase [Pseudomonadales bacterium]NNM11131.1 RES family NAD+ phosphorylase [Pseudomonadales bacterium]
MTRSSPQTLLAANVNRFNFATLQQRLARTTWRVVETQEIAATQAITQNAADQARLEALLEASKPALAEDCAGLSYLLFTPFRYPPLPFGSRFGGQFERGIYYAALTPEAAFAECALYLWLFQQGPQELGPLANIRDQRTAFSARIRSARAIDTCSEHFSRVSKKISDPASWEFSQKLGAALREVRTAYCLYASPRLAGATNVAVFDPKSFADKAPREIQHWHLALDTERCRFSRRGFDGSQTIEFEYSQFTKNGRIPHPAMHKNAWHEDA